MRLVNFIVYMILKSFLFLGRIVPMGFSFWWVRGLARISYRLAKNRRALMLWNLEHALGDETTPEQREDGR